MNIVGLLNGGGGGGGGGEHVPPGTPPLPGSATVMLLSATQIRCAICKHWFLNWPATQEHTMSSIPSSILILVNNAAHCLNGDHIWRNCPYIGGHLALFFQIDF